MVYWPHTAEPVPTQGPVSTHESLSTPGPVSTLGPVSTPGPTLEIELQPTDSLITVFTIVALALVTAIKTSPIVMDYAVASLAIVYKIVATCTEK